MELGGGLFAPQAGESFDLLMADIMVGEFDLWNFAGLDGRFIWQTEPVLSPVSSQRLPPTSGGLCLIALQPISLYVLCSLS